MSNVHFAFYDIIVRELVEREMLILDTEFTSGKYLGYCPKYLQATYVLKWE